MSKNKSRTNQYQNKKQFKKQIERNSKVDEKKILNKGEFLFLVEKNFFVVIYGKRENVKIMRILLFTGIFQKQEEIRCWPWFAMVSEGWKKEKKQVPMLLDRFPTGL